MARWLSTALDILNRLNVYTGNIEPNKMSYSETKVDTMPVPDAAYNYMVQDYFDSIEYDSTHLWFCKMDDAPAPFNKWFPAQNCSEPLKGATTSSTSFGIEEVQTLNSYSASTMRVDFIDDANATLERWFSKWQRAIGSTDDGLPYTGFRYLEEIVKKLYIVKYNWQKQKIYTKLFLVLPSGDISNEHSNEPTLKALTVNFAIFGRDEVENENI